jgi:hypothetical protein
VSGIFGAFGGSLVGSLAQDVYGYVPSDNDIVDMDSALRDGNEKALGHAVTVGVLVPWALNIVVYALMFQTLENDRNRMEIASSRYQQHGDDPEVEDNDEF